jgi:hypothetical protein
MPAPITQVAPLRIPATRPCGASDSWNTHTSRCSAPPEFGREHQDNSNIHYQPFPESVSEEHEIYTDYDGDHCHHVKHDSYLSVHFSLEFWPVGQPCCIEGTRTLKSSKNAIWMGLMVIEIKHQFSFDSISESVAIIPSFSERRDSNPHSSFC